MKTSIWLPDDIAERWKASEVSLVELVRRGLDAGKPEPLDDKLGRIMDDKLMAQDERLRRMTRTELERATGQTHT